MRAALLAILLAAGLETAQAQGAPPPPAPRSVGTGITVVPGAPGAAPPPARAPAEASAPAPAATPKPTPPPSADSATTDLLRRRDEFIKRSVMRSICRGC